MKAFYTSILIDAPAERVWAVLTDLPAWTDWNKTIDKVVGEAVLNGKVTVYAKANPGRAFPLKVSVFTPPLQMVWSGGMPFGLFSGRRTYTLKQRTGGTTQFEMAEAFTGLLAPLITRSIPDLQPSFDEFARCLKSAAEAV